MSTLKEYLFYKEKSVTDFAKELMVSRSYLNKIVLGKTTPSRLLAKEIERATDGKVKADELLQELTVCKKEKIEPKTNNEEKPNMKMSPKGYMMEKSIFDNGGYL